MTLTPAHCLRAGLLILGTGVAISIIDAPGAVQPAALLIAAVALAGLVAFGELIVRRGASRTAAEASHQASHDGS